MDLQPEHDDARVRSFDHEGEEQGHVVQGRNFRINDSTSCADQALIRLIVVHRLISEY